MLGSADPRFNLEPDERWRADDLVGDDAAYSGLIRTGMAEVLVLLASSERRPKVSPMPSYIRDKVVKRLLGTADAERWWSLHRQLRVLAEASPEEFLNAVDKNLAQNDPPIMKLFEEGGDPLFFGGGGEYPHLLWALEVLAWSPDYLARVTDILAKLTELDPEGRLTNRPRNTFQDIYRLWRPQTFATLQQRNAVLKRLRKTYPQTAWDCCSTSIQKAMTQPPIVQRHAGEILAPTRLKPRHMPSSLRARKRSEGGCSRMSEPTRNDGRNYSSDLAILPPISVKTSCSGWWRPHPGLRAIMTGSLSSKLCAGSFIIIANSRMPAGRSLPMNCRRSRTLIIYFSRRTSFFASNGCSMSIMRLFSSRKTRAIWEANSSASDKERRKALS